MQKIKSLFQRNYEGDRLVRDELVPGTEWVAAGEGEATLKRDGTCCLVREGRLFKRYDAKLQLVPPERHAEAIANGGHKIGEHVYLPTRPLPKGFEPAQDPDPITMHWPGWVAIGNGPDDQWHREAWVSKVYPDGTYELIGPKIQGNVEKQTTHTLIRHGSEVVQNFPRTFGEIKAMFASAAWAGIEGVVFHHPDGRMVKVKRRDFFPSGPKRK